MGRRQPDPDEVDEWQQKNVEIQLAALYHHSMCGDGIVSVDSRLRQMISLRATRQRKKPSH